MKKILLAVALLCALAFPSAASAVNLQGKYLQSCTLANSGQVDPLVSPGVVSDHPHDEFGATNWTTTSTTADFLGGDTTCFNSTNHASYWVPSMMRPDGTLAHAKYASGYYGAFGADPALIPGHKIQPFPQGLRFIVGNPKSAVRQSTSIVRWRCDKAGFNTLSAPPTSCPEGVGIELMFVSPPCWDGLTLDAPDHHSNMAYGVTGGGCPADHPIRVPELLWSFHYGPDAVGACPASDHGIAPCGRSAHMDLWEAQDAFGQALLTQCLNDPTRNTQGGSPDPTLCGIFTYSGGINGVAPNPWLANLNAWNGKLDYVACAPVGSLIDPANPAGPHCTSSQPAKRTAP